MALRERTCISFGAETERIGYYCTHLRRPNWLPSEEWRLWFVCVENALNISFADFFRLCKRSAEMLFDPLESSLDAVRQQIGDTKEGDVFVTLHSNIHGAHVALHLIGNLHPSNTINNRSDNACRASNHT